MYLMRHEYEAFIRGKAAGLIPHDLPVPENEEQINELIAYIGVMFSRTVGYRTRSGKFSLVNISIFSEKYFPELISKLQWLIPEIFIVTSFQRESFFTPLEALANYFALGIGGMDELDIVNRLSVFHPELTVNEIRKGFEHEFKPEILSGLASMEQRIALSELVVQHVIPPIARRKWENLTEREAAELLSQKHSVNPVSPAVKTAIKQYDRLTLEEKVLFRELTNKKTEENSWLKRMEQNLSRSRN